MRPQRNRILLTLKESIPVLLEKYGVTRIGIFGSVARDDASEESDVDIVYEMSRPNLFTVVHLKEELENILHCPVDLVRYRQRMNPLLKKRIEQEGVYV
ncbi:MAG: nucleotidyltransferase family protein [Planctomycetota bacterium]